MGWSVDIIREEIEAILGPAGIKFQLEFPDSQSPRVHLTYNRDIPIETKRAIAKKFPDNVHVYFMVTNIPENQEGA